MTGAGSDTFAGATPFQLGTISDPTPTAGLSFGGYRSAWWLLEVPAGHDPSTRIRLDLLLSPTDVDTQGRYEVDTLIEVLLPASQPPRMDNLETVRRLDDGGTGVGWLLTDGDVALDPGTYYVRCSLYGYSADTAYVLRIGDLTYGEPTTYGPFAPPVQVARRDFGFSGQPGQPAYGITSQAPNESGTMHIQDGALAGMLDLSGGQRGAAGDWHQYIDDISGAQTLAQRDPLPTSVLRPLVVDTVNGTGVPGGHEQSGDGSQGDQFYPDGQRIYNAHDGGPAYEFRRTDWAVWGLFSGLGAISANTHHTMSVGTPPIPADATAFLNQGWDIGKQGFPTYSGTLTYDAPGQVLAQRLIVAVGLEGGYTEPTDRVVLGILRGTDEQPLDPNDVRALPTWLPTLDNVKALAVLPVPATAGDELTYRAIPIPDGFTFDATAEGWGQDKFVAIASPALVPARTSLPAEPGWAGGQEALPDTWAWRFTATTKAWPDNSTDARALSITVYVGVEYLYQPPAWHWTVRGPRQTVLVTTLPDSPPWLRALQRSDGLDLGGPPRAVQQATRADSLRAGTAAI